jgi:tRNA-specific adenosine deaminase 2
MGSEEHGINENSSSNATHDPGDDAEQYMRLALKVAHAALAVGEVPVGCVIVLDTAKGSVVVSHGANQVNATRDATRHAEIVAIDRMLTGGLASDQLRLPPETIAKAAHGVVPAPLFHSDDRWVNVPRDANHWKNDYGWGSGKVFEPDVFPLCDLYVTCEPCIMVS